MILPVGFPKVEVYFQVQVTLDDVFVNLAQVCIVVQQFISFILYWKMTKI